MLKRVFIFLLATLLSFAVYAQQDTGIASNTSLIPDKSHLRISLITCTPGNEPWEIFGHSAIRVIDSSKNDGERDKLYNYGTLDFFDASFFSKFFLGDMESFLDSDNYEVRFIKLYTDEHRGVDEYVLQLNDGQKDSILSYLKNNLLTENKYSQYEVFLNNCSTPVRDMLSKVLGNGLVFGPAIPDGRKQTFRQSFNWMCRHHYWIRLGLNLICSGRIADREMNNSESMYLAPYLRNAISGASINGKRLCGDELIILEDTQEKSAGINTPFIIILVVALLTIFSLSVKRFRFLGKIMSTLVLVSSGIVGCLLIYAWMGGINPEWKDNYNILWALPTNIIIPFFNPKIKVWYAVVAMFLLGIALVIHLLKIQVMPLFEITSFLLALLLIYIRMYKDYKMKFSTT